MLYKLLLLLILINSPFATLFSVVLFDSLILFYTILFNRCTGPLGERVVLGHHKKLGMLLWPKFKLVQMFTQVGRVYINESTCREVADLPHLKDVNLSLR